MQSFEEFVSLGTNCRTRYQLDRQQRPTSYYFDWTISCVAAVLSHVETGFQAAHQTLAYRDDGLIWDDPHDVRFDHAFTLTDGRVSPETFAAERARMVEKFDYLARKTMMRLARPGALYVVNGGYDPQGVIRLREVLGQPVLHVTYADEPRGRIGEWDYEMTAAVPKPPQFQWQGNDAAWDEMFRRLGLRSEAQATDRIERRA